MTLALLNLKLLAVTLLIAAQASYVPVELRVQAMSLATTIMAYVDVAAAAPVPTSEPAPTPTVTTTSTLPTLVPNPVITFAAPAPVAVPTIPEVSNFTFTLAGGAVEVNVIESLSFTTNVPVMCLGATLTTSCNATTPAQVKQLPLTCNAQWDKGQYLFIPNQTYTCTLRLSGEIDGTKVFTVTP